MPCLCKQCFERDSKITISSISKTDEYRNIFPHFTVFYPFVLQKGTFHSKCRCQQGTFNQLYHHMGQPLLKAQMFCFITKIISLQKASCFKHTDSLHHWIIPSGFKEINKITALNNRVRAYCSELKVLKGNTHDMIKAEVFMQNVSHCKVGNAL